MRPYDALPCSRWMACSVLLSCLTAVIGAADLPLRQVLPAALYRPAADQLLAGIRPDALLASGNPDDGLHVDKIRRGSPGDALGIRAGDIFCALDGDTPPDLDYFLSHRRPLPQRLTLWSPRGGLRTVTIQPGLLGAYTTPVPWRPEITYLHALGSAPPDPDLLVACLAWRRDVALCETALARAQAAGATTAPFHQLAGEILFCDGDYAASHAAGLVALAESHTPPGRYRAIKLLYDDAMCMDRFSEARSYLTAVPHLPDALATLDALAAQASRSDAAPGPAHPVDAAPSLPVDASARLVGIDAGGQRLAHDLIAGQGRARIGDPKLAYPVKTLGPAGGDCVLSGRLALFAAETGGRVSPLRMSIALVDLAHGGAPIVWVSFSHTGAAIIRRDGVPAFTSHPLTAEPGGYRFLISLVGDRIRVALNGRQLLAVRYAYPASQRTLAFCLCNTFTAWDLTDLSWRLDAITDYAQEQPIAAGQASPLPAGDTARSAGTVDDF